MEWFFLTNLKNQRTPLHFPALIILILLNNLGDYLLFLVLLPPWLFTLSYNFFPQLAIFWKNVNPIFAAIIAFLIFTFVHYWSHVARHHFRFLWRWCHELHHSVRQFDAFAAIYVHPFEIIFQKFCISVVMIALGFDPVTIATFFVIFRYQNALSHANIRTPKWMGYFILRPEQHSHHHAVAAENFGILPLWDIVFGTFRNPQEHPERVGFDPSDERGFVDFLLGRSH